MKRSSEIRLVSFCAAVCLFGTTGPVGAQTNYQRLKSFGLPDPGTQPHSALMLGMDGALYGTTQMGGAANQGTLFRLKVDGTGYSVLHDFSTNYDGKNPVGALLPGQDGALYGTTVYGGSNRCGTIFALATNGGKYAVIHHFNKTDLGGAQFPYGALVQGSNGVLYGTTSLSTNSGPGTVYQINTNGAAFSVLHTFATNSAEGMNPGGLILGLDGALYGASQRSKSTAGAIFKVNVDGTGFTVWTNIPTSGQRAHLNALRQGTNGILYGTTCYNTNAETVFSVGTNAGGYQVLHTFLRDGVDGQGPDTQLLQGLDGAFYGTTLSGGTNGAGTIFRINGDGSGYALLYQFQTNDVDGRWPEDSLIQGGDGTLYGTTLRGGLSGDGTVYAIKPDGTSYRQLHQFNSFASEGQMPSGAVVPDGGGFLYGTTQRGGNGNYGTLFKFGSDGSNYSIAHHFGGAGSGQWPSGRLLRGQDGAWYGTTCAGGSNAVGCIFKLMGDGNGFVVIYNFAGTNDGDAPCDALAQGPTGELYGITAAGGSNGVGTVFKVGTNGNGFVVLHTFLTNGVDGSSPSGSLLLGNDGGLYGVAEGGGSNNVGSIFKLNTDGSAYRTLHTFQTNNGDGINPEAGLLQGRSGTLYGTTRLGGAEVAGTVFRLNTDGSGYSIANSLSSSLTNSLTFTRGLAELVQASGDTFYGSLYEGGGTNVYGGLLFQVGTNGGGYKAVHSFGTTPADGLNPAGALVLSGTSWYGLTEFGGEFGAGSLYALAVIPAGISAQPQSQTVLAGSSATFSTVVSGSPSDYQWFFNGAPLANATTLDVTLAAVGRADGGVYTMSVSNVAGTLMSSNALLTVLVPQHLGTPQLLPDGTLLIQSAYADGWPLTSGDLVRFHAQVSSNLIDWVTLNSPLTVSNGMLSLIDGNIPGNPSRFYRVLEIP